MIIESMSYEEIISAFEKDWEKNVKKFMHRELNSSKYRRTILKMPSSLSKAYYFKPVLYTSPEKINYILLVYTSGKHDYKTRGLGYILLVLYKRNNETYVMMPDPDKIVRPLFYTSHLFKRYRERELKNPQLSMMDTIIEFFKYNSISFSKDIDSEKYKDSVFSRINQGILLGSKVLGDIVEFKTYLSIELLKNSQIDTSINLEIFRNSYIESMKKDLVRKRKRK